MRRTAWAHARSLGLALFFGWCAAWAPPARAQQGGSPDLIDDWTSYSFVKIADGSPAVLPVTRTFPRNIKRLRLTIAGGAADDIGYVGGMLVTTVRPSCQGVGMVETPVDVTSQVAVNGNTASFTLTAVENCCCYTGWGGAGFHWQVELEPECSEQVCSAQCAPGATDVVPKLSTSWSTRSYVSCGVVGGQAGGSLKVKVAGSFDPAQCSGGCKSKGKASGEVEGEGQLCGLSQTLAGALEYEQSTGFEQTCNQDACGMQCDPDRYCAEGSGGFSGRFEQAREKEFPLTYRVRSRGSRTFGNTASCKARVKGGIGVKVGMKQAENHGSSNPTCRTCLGATGELSGEAAGSGGCKVDVRVAGLEVPLNCSDCAELKLSGAFKGSYDTCGEGGLQDCTSGSVSIEGKLGLPQACLSLFGMRVKYTLSGKLSETCTADTCVEGGFSCDPKVDGSANMSIDFNTKC